MLICLKKKQKFWFNLLNIQHLKIKPYKSALMSVVNRQLPKKKKRLLARKQKAPKNLKTYKMHSNHQYAFNQQKRIQIRLQKLKILCQERCLLKKCLNVNLLALCLKLKIKKICLKLNYPNYLPYNKEVKKKPIMKWLKLQLNLVECLNHKMQLLPKTK